MNLHPAPTNGAKIREMRAAIRRDGTFEDSAATAVSKENK